MILNNRLAEFSSYKDKCAEVYYENGFVYRKINKSYIAVYEKFIESKLYEKLLSENLIIPHELTEKNNDYIIIKPQKTIITYPWEWSFSQLKDCAITTLKIQKIALEYGFSLKDANFFNIQFYKNKPVLIDTTSFEEYKNNQIWIGYKQFCENFLSPLSLCAYVNLKMSDMLIKNIDGISLKLTSKLLPQKTYFNLGLLTHIHLQALFQKSYSENTNKISANLSKESLKNLISNLMSTINSINLPKSKTDWGNYYSKTNYSKDSFEDKKNIINSFKNKINPKTVLDFGANTGVFSRLFRDSFCYSVDFDQAAIEYNYQTVKQNNEENIFPLVFDITNPSPAVGFYNKERKDFITRINNVDLVMALALIHHLVLKNNLTFEKLAQYFCDFGKYLIIEFVDKKDSQIEKMLKNREDVFSEYNMQNFESVFKKFYNIIDKQEIKNTKRTLYLMEKI